jgi:hypothetical protein
VFRAGFVGEAARLAVEVGCAEASQTRADLVLREKARVARRTLQTSMVTIVRRKEEKKDENRDFLFKSL